MFHRAFFARSRLLVLQIVLTKVDERTFRIRSHSHLRSVQSAALAGQAGGKCNKAKCGLYPPQAPKVEEGFPFSIGFGAGSLGRDRRLPTGLHAALCACLWLCCRHHGVCVRLLCAAVPHLLEKGSDVVLFTCTAHKSSLVKLA